MKFFITLLLCFFSTFLYSQQFNEDEFDVFVSDLNTKIKGYKDPTTGIEGVGVTHLSNTIIFQYEIPDNWIFNENHRDELLINLLKNSNTDLYYNNKINLMFNYFNNKSLIKSVKYQWSEFDVNVNVSEYIYFKDLPKSNGLDFKIKPPVGWEVRDGGGEHVVKKFTKESKVFLIIINENSSFKSKEEVEEFFSKNENIETIVNSTGVNIDNSKSEVFSIQSYPFIYSEGNIEGERLGIKFNSKFFFCYSILEDQIIQFQYYGDNKNDFIKILNTVLFQDL